MTIKEEVALDIYTYLYRTYFGTDSDEQKFRIKYGSNGVIYKVLDYIQKTYFKKDDKNE
jgi:hypothetical protein